MIAVFGTVCIDRVRRVPQLPPVGGYVEISEEFTLLGGEAANTSSALRGWGNEVRLIGNPIGNDHDGDTLRALLCAKYLENIELVRSDFEGELATPVCDIYVTPDGERTMFGRGFSRSGLSLELSRINFGDADWFTAEPNMELESRDAVRRAVQSGLKVYLMDFIRPDDPVGPGVYWQSSTDWAGHRNNMQRNVRWVKDFVASKGSFCVLSDGPNGFVAGSPDLPVKAYPPFPAPDVLDTTGAGDMFRAGMLHGLNRGWNIHECLQFASAAGCLKCQYLGATTRQPSISEIENHIRENADVARQYH